MIKTINLLLLKPIINFSITIVLILTVRLVFTYHMIPIVHAEGLDYETISRIDDAVYTRTKQNDSTFDERVLEIEEYRKIMAARKVVYEFNNARPLPEVLDLPKNPVNNPSIFKPSEHTSDKPIILQAVVDSKTSINQVTLKEILTTPGIDEVLTKSDLALLRELSKLEYKHHAGSSALAKAINALLPNVSPQHNHYEDFHTSARGDNYESIARLDTIAYNTNNQMLQRYVAQYNVACHVFTCKKHNLPLRKETMDRIFNTIMERYEQPKKEI
jgi:hypothetical protein